MVENSLEKLLELINRVVGYKTDIKINCICKISMKILLIKLSQHCIYFSIKKNKALKNKLTEEV